MKYHFDKNFVLTAHTLEAQLRSFREMMQRREEAHKQPWVDTVPNMTNEEAEEKLWTQSLNGSNPKPTGPRS